MEIYPANFWRTVTLILLFAVGTAIVRADGKRPQEPLIWLGSYPSDEPNRPRDGYVMDGVYYMGGTYFENLLLSHGIVSKGDSDLGMTDFVVRRSQARKALALAEEAVKQGKLTFTRSNEPVP